MTTLGVSMIVKNGMETLPRLLEQLTDFIVTGLINEVVIVDTGSTDGTLDYLEKWAAPQPQARIETFKWTGRFDDARNYALTLMTTEWVMWLDADDIIAHFPSPFLMHTDVDSYYVPYHYTIDDTGAPVLVQKRERIIRNPKNWVWKNPVHEVLEYVGEGTPVFRDYPGPFAIKHHPVRDETYSDRNYKILLNEWLRHGYKIGPFMAYYLMRESYSRKEYATAHLLATRLIENTFDDAALPFQQYEALLISARIASAFGWQYMEVAGQYIRAIRLIPELNEAKVEYIMWLISRPQNAVACEMVHQLSESPPDTVGVVDHSMYGSHVWALRAFVGMHTGQNVATVMSDLLKALDYPVVSALCHTVDDWVRKQLAHKRIGIVYAETDLYEIGKAVASKLEQEDVFREVYVMTSPLAANYAQGIYFHVGDLPTLYKEETDPYTIRVLISPKEIPSNYSFGWGFKFLTSDSVDDIFNLVFGQIAVVQAKTLKSALNMTKAVNEKYVCICDPDITFTPEEWQQMLDCLREYPNGVIAINENPINGFVAKRSILLEYGQQLPNCYDSVLRTQTAVDEEFASPGVMKRKQKKVYFYAEGVEPWEGTTPYRIGIGASEASVVYLAEQFAAAGYDTYVFSPVQQVQEIDGVTYVPNLLFGQYPCPDVLISSRCPHILTKRYAPVQILWLHDLYQHTAFPEECVFDKLVCVSNREQRKAAKDWGHKVITIPNPYNPNNCERNPVINRCVWLSSPDRGIANFTNWFKEDELDMWLTYSYFNARVMRAHDPMQFRRIWEEKYKLRQHGINLVGRLGIYELRRLLSTCMYWPYASTFEETFCVAALEATGAGVLPIYTCYGATMETIQRFTKALEDDTLFYDLTHPEDVLDEFDWLRAQDCPEFDRTISEEVFPENVYERWSRILQ